MHFGVCDLQIRQHVLLNPPFWHSGAAYTIISMNNYQGNTIHHIIMLSIYSEISSKDLNVCGLNSQVEPGAGSLLTILLNLTEVIWVR